MSLLIPSSWRVVLKLRLNLVLERRSSGVIMWYRLRVLVRMSIMSLLCRPVFSPRILVRVRMNWLIRLMSPLFPVLIRSLRLVVLLLMSRMCLVLCLRVKRI